MPEPPSSISDLTRLLQADPAPILLLDTCAVLDVSRSLYRDRAPRFLAQQALNAIQAASSAAPKVRLIVPEKVIQEYSKNRIEVFTELHNRVAQVSLLGDTLLSATDSAFLRTTLTSLESSLTALADRLLDVSLPIAADQPCVSRASARLIGNFAPAKKGSTNDGDCIVIEHYLELVRQLRGAGFSHDCIFVSSNHRDFGIAPFPKQPLDSEFAVIRIDYLPDIAAAMNQLGF